MLAKKRERNMNNESNSFHACSILDAIGNTPLLKISMLDAIIPKHVSVFAKAEFLNPGGSVKDRPAKNMILHGIASGELTKDKIILDSSSGNTAISYAMIASALGYAVELVIPSNASSKHKIIQTYGAKIIYTDSMEGSDGAMQKASKIYTMDMDRYFMPNQYSNPYNWKAHYETTAQEIWEQTNGEVTHFVAGIGTSGTLMGVGRRLKELNPDIKIIAVEPADSLHGLEGLKHMQSSIVPHIYDALVHDYKISIDTEVAYEVTCRLAKEQGLFLGYSSGAAVHACYEIAHQIREGVVVSILCDRGDRYIESQFWDGMLQSL